MMGWMKKSAPRVALILGLFLTVSGCSSTSSGSGRMPPYRPQVADADPKSWSPARESSPTDVGVQSRPSDSSAPVLHRGDEVLVLLKDIPKEDQFSETVDDKGCIKMPLLGNAKVEGRSTSDAERMVELAYVRLGYYKKITVVIRKQDDRFYIMGEVKREGQYPIAGDMTLSQALALASGFTDFADLTEVQINRGEQVLKFNMKKIRKQDAEDPPIMAGDTIYVPRSSF